MLVRELLGWLRYCLQHDPVCLANGIVAEEIPSSFLSYIDVSDGPRTIGIYRADTGYTSRIEIRFTAERPQVWYISTEDNAANGKYLITPSSDRFPGSTRAWTRTQFVRYLIDLARAKLCNDTVAFLNIVPASVEVQAMKQAKIDDTPFMRIFNASLSSVKKGTKLSVDKVIKFITENSFVSKPNAELELAYATAFYLYKHKIKDRDLENFIKGLEKGGMDNFHKALCPHLLDPLLEKILSPEWQKKATECAGPVLKEQRQKEELEAGVRKIVDMHNRGLEPSDLFAGEIKGAFGDEIQAALTAEQLPLPYLALLEKADYKEKIAPWSLIRRSILAYDIPKDNSKPVQDEIVNWLDKSSLIAALYKSEDDTLKDLIRSKVKIFAEKTIRNPNWVKEIYNEIVAITSEHDRAKALQAEFDMWVLQALSPSVSASKLPLSPHSYNTGKQDEELYNKVFGSWLYEVKKSAAERREQSIKNLSTGLDNFYKEISAGWDSDMLVGYQPRIPNVKDIMLASTKGNKEKLFDVLVADVEDEVGVKIPDEIKETLIASPYFNSIYREVRFQSVKL